MKRRAFLSLLAATPAGVAWARYVEPHWFDISHTRIVIPGVRPTRILHISDIHISDGMTAEALQIGLDAGLSQHPDLICFTGDFVSQNVGFDRPGLLRLLRRAARTAPSYAVLGNHDGGAWLARHGGDHSVGPLSELVESAGIRLLHNNTAVERGITLIGVGDFWSGQFHPARAFARGNPHGPAVVLCHNPDGKEELSAWSWDLMLSGHTHGGQACIPGFTPVWAPVQDKRFVAGLYSWDNRQLFISRGLGSPRHVRAFCRPEVAILDLAACSV